MHSNLFNTFFKVCHFHCACVLLLGASVIEDVTFLTTSVRALLCVILSGDCWMVLFTEPPSCGNSSSWCASFSAYWTHGFSRYTALVYLHCKLYTQYWAAPTAQLCHENCDVGPHNIQQHDSATYQSCQPWQLWKSLGTAHSKHFVHAGCWATKRSWVLAELEKPNC